MTTELAGPCGSDSSAVLGPSAQVQACRPEDRAMLATPAGAELVACVTAALNEEHEPPDLIVRLLAAARDLGIAEDLRLLCGEAAAEVDRLETLAAVREWAATSASVHLGGVIEEAQAVVRAIHDEAERVDLPSGGLTLLTAEMKTRLAEALLLCPKCCLKPCCPDCKAVHDVPIGA